MNNKERNGLIKQRRLLREKCKEIDKEIDRIKKEYERIYNENCKLRENHNINDITLLDENERLNNIINESAEEILKELEENHHLSYGVALAIRQKLLDYKELKGSDKE